MSISSPETPPIQPDPIQAGAEAAHNLTGEPKPHWLERWADRLGHPKDKPIKIGGLNSAWDAPAQTLAKKPTPTPEQQLTPEEQAIAD